MLDRDEHGCDDLIGSVKIAVADLPAEGVLDRWYRLRNEAAPQLTKKALLRLKISVLSNAVSSGPGPDAVPPAAGAISRSGSTIKPSAPTPVSRTASLKKPASPLSLTPALPLAPGDGGPEPGGAGGAGPGGAGGGNPSDGSLASVGTFEEIRWLDKTLASLSHNGGGGGDEGEEGDGFRRGWAPRPGPGPPYGAEPAAFSGWDPGHVASGANGTDRAEHSVQLDLDRTGAADGYSSDDSDRGPLAGDVLQVWACLRALASPGCVGVGVGVGVGVSACEGGLSAGCVCACVHVLSGGGPVRSRARCASWPEWGRNEARSGASTLASTHTHTHTQTSTRAPTHRRTCAKLSSGLVTQVSALHLP